jgi:hypothetical protein
MVASPNFRPSTVADEGAIVALLRESLGLAPGHPTLDPNLLRWKYWEPRADWVGSRSYVYLRNGQIVAHGAVIPNVCLWQGHRITMLHVIDWAAKPDSGGSGVALMKQIGKLTDAMFAVGGSELTQQILPVIGFSGCDTTVTRYARPVRPLLRFVNPEYWSWRLAPQAMRGALWALTAPSRRDIEWNSHRILADQLTADSIIWPSAKSGIAAFERSNAAMSYLLRCPTTPMELYSVHGDGRPRGYFLLAFAPAQARIVDCWIDSSDLTEWSAMVQLAVEQAKAHSQVQEVVSMCSDPILGAALLNRGFRIRQAIPMWLRVAGGAARPDAGIRFLMADSDEAFLHNGRNRMWA